MLIDGVPGDAIQIMDRGLAYGDGVFRTLAVSGGVPEFWPQHMAKLAADCARLAIPAPDAAALAADARALLAGADRAVLKFIVTRGVGGRGYKPPDAPQPTRVALRAAYPAYGPELAERGVVMRLCETRLGQQPRLAGVKHLNRLEQVLARAEWSDPEIAEGLMLDADGRAIEGVMSNLFVVKGSEVVTPDLARCGVAGMTRELLLESARIADVTLEDVRAADELFLTNSLIGVWPVRRFDGRDYPVGPVTRRWAAALEKLRQASLGAFPAY
ncbi:MAG: aminodeoxychorismate lyase [Alphaproteobacteria bacterium]